MIDLDIEDINEEDYEEDNDVSIADCLNCPWPDCVDCYRTNPELLETWATAKVIPPRNNRQKLITDIYDQGYKMEEVAEMLSLSMTTVSNHLRMLGYPTMPKYINKDARKEFIRRWKQ